MDVRYGTGNECWSLHVDFVERLVQRTRAVRVCDIGAGANPMLSLPFIRQHALDYIALDVDEAELAKAESGYQSVVGDVLCDDLDLGGPVDLVISRMVAEHAVDPRRFHANIRRLLKPGGRAFHFFPTLYALPFVANRVLPELVTRPLLRRMMRGREDEGREGKFRAYYRWCRGPSPRQRRRFESVGYVVEEYAGFFGHGYYYKVEPLHRLEEQLAQTLVRHPVPFLTAFAWVVLRRRD